MAHSRRAILMTAICGGVLTAIAIGADDPPAESHVRHVAVFQSQTHLVPHSLPD